MEKTCSKCKITKPLVEFSKDKRGRLGVCVWCKDCSREYKKIVQTKYGQRRQLKIHTDSKYKDYVRARDRAWRRDNPQLTLYRSAKNRAKRNSLEFSITKEDIIIPEKCPILEIPFVPGVRGEYKYSYSLDRIDNSKGYIPGNVRVISALANHMKNQASYDELKMFAKNILNYCNYNTKKTCHTEKKKQLRNIMM